MAIKSIKIQNFKSIRETEEILLNRLNVLIGANGAGKSNFISFFKFLNSLSEQSLQFYISRNGMAKKLLYFGRKKSDFLGGKITFDNDWQDEYEFKMVPADTGLLIFSEEWSNYTKPGQDRIKLSLNVKGKPESALMSVSGKRNKLLRNYFSSFKIFHFQDTGFNSKLKDSCSSIDYAYLNEDGGNLPAFLYFLERKHPANFKLIVKVIQSIAPFFDKFFLGPDEVNPLQMYLRWQEKGYDQILTAHNLSDGTLRMMCLTTLLLQPNLPSTIIIDEPELGLHPFAITKLAAMIKSASSKTQLIISTQSVNLLDQFDADDVIVVEREDNQTVFRRQNAESLKDWLDEYSIGELWDKNVLGGRPR